MPTFNRMPLALQNNPHNTHTISPLSLRYFNQTVLRNADDTKTHILGHNRLKAFMRFIPLSQETQPVLIQLFQDHCQAIMLDPASRNKTEGFIHIAHALAGEKPQIIQSILLNLLKEKTIIILKGECKDSDYFDHNFRLLIQALPLFKKELLTILIDNYTSIIGRDDQLSMQAASTRLKLIKLSFNDNPQDCFPILSGTPIAVKANLKSRQNNLNKQAQLAHISLATNRVVLNAQRYKIPCDSASVKYTNNFLKHFRPGGC